jgi:hypothetical protein
MEEGAELLEDVMGVEVDVKESEGVAWLVVAASGDVAAESGTPELLEGSKLLCAVKKMRGGVDLEEGEDVPWLVAAASVGVTSGHGTPELLEGSKSPCVVDMMEVGVYVEGEGVPWLVAVASESVDVAAGPDTPELLAAASVDVASVSGSPELLDGIKLLCVVDMMGVEVGVEEGEGVPWLVTAASVNVDAESWTPELLEGDKLLCVVGGGGPTNMVAGPARRVPLASDSSVQGVMKTVTGPSFTPNGRKHLSTGKVTVPGMTLPDIWQQKFCRHGGYACVRNTSNVV